jgi:hypothetical protein
VLCQVTGHPLFIRWAKLMGEEKEWLSDPRFADDLKRGDHGPHHQRADGALVRRAHHAGGFGYDGARQ